MDIFDKDLNKIDLTKEKRHNFEAIYTYFKEDVEMRFDVWLDHYSHVMLNEVQYLGIFGNKAINEIKGHEDTKTAAFEVIVVYKDGSVYNSYLAVFYKIDDNDLFLKKIGHQGLNIENDEFQKIRLLEIAEKMRS